MIWLMMARNVLFALVLIISMHIALHKPCETNARALTPSVVFSPQTNAAQNTDAQKSTMPLDGLREMFEYARAADEWGETSVIVPPERSGSPRPSDLALVASEPGPSEALPAPVSAFDGWPSAASF